MNILKKQMKQFISFSLYEIRVPFNMLASILPNEQLEILKMMDASSSLMTHMLNDVLDMDKIEAGKLQLMGELVSSLIRDFKDTLDSKGIEFILRIIEAKKKFLFSS
jgi:signal transduction histidine kinase